MITDDEARDYYTEFLRTLGALNALPLVREIQRAVSRGELRAKHGSRKKQPDAYQMPLSAKEALIVALRMFLSALDPAFQLANVQETLRKHMGSVPVEISWEFDPVVSTEGRDAAETDVGALGELNPVPLLVPKELYALRCAAEHLVTLLNELEEEQERS